MPDTRSKNKHRYWEPLLIGISAAIGLLAGYNMNFNNQDYSILNIEKNSKTAPSKDGRIEEILRFVESNYVDSLDQDEVSINAIRHILQELDPHSSYITAEELDDHQEKMDGEYKGIGIETLDYNDTFYIVNVLEGSPAHKNGIEIGDAIISVNNEKVAGNETSFASIRKKLKGDGGVIDLELLSIGESNSKTLKLDPKNIEMPSADLAYMLDEEIAYLKITRFSGNTYEQFMKSIENLSLDRSKLDLIIDLRNNPGGYLPETVNILSQLFDEKDKLLCYTKGLNRKKSEYFSTGKNFFEIGKIVVIVNEYSASGSEILAGAMQDWDRGIVIGQPSFGKGLVQEIFPLNNGGALRLTVAKYYTPSGRLIQKPYEKLNSSFVKDSNDYKTLLLNRDVYGGGGIIPDIELSDDDSEYCYRLGEYIDYYILDTMIQSGSIAINFEREDNLRFKNFAIDLFGSDIDVLFDNCDKDLLLQIQSRYIRMTKGDTEYFKFLNAQDNHLDKAVDVIKDKRTTMALLSQEN